MINFFQKYNSAKEAHYRGTEPNPTIKARLVSQEANVGAIKLEKTFSILLL